MCEDCNDNSLEVDDDFDHSFLGSSFVSIFYLVSFFVLIETVKDQRICLRFLFGYFGAILAKPTKMHSYYIIPEKDTCKNIKDSTTLMLLIGPESVVTIQGHCYGDISNYREERSTQAWIVDCPCGTKEDDGERMIACDNCEVWQHTRCVDISDSEDVPT